ncbi:MAG TPA: acyl-CoA dehydrogenase family protein [Polyangiaceae bacterium]|nr:acyl-CoA dehydrogenase family protein [Polyangiaceae bacterium]
MHLELDEDLALLREGARAFATARVRPGSRAWEEARAIDPAVLDEGWALGFAALGVGPSLGGAAPTDDVVPSALLGAVVTEELAWADLGFALACLSPMHVVVPLAMSGDRALAVSLLPRLLGERLPAATGAWVEPTLAYDPWAIGASASATPGGPAITGKKTLVPRADVAALTLIAARRGTGGGAEQNRVFLSEERASGATACDVIAPRAVGTFDVGYRGASVREIGKGGEAWYSALAERLLVGTAAAAVGVGRAATEYAAEYAKERRAFGRAIAQNQSIAFMLAESAMDIEAARWLTWKAAWKIDRARDTGDGARREASRAARFATAAAFRAADSCVQILGGHGVIRDHLAELFFRNARTLARTPGWFIV